MTPGERSVDILIRLSGQAQPDGPARDGFLEEMSRLVGAEIRPLHSGTADPDLGRWAVARMPPEFAEQALTVLAGTPGIDAAYVKPAGMPAGEESAP